MDFSGCPRHQLRAAGRQNGRPQTRAAQVRDLVRPEKAVNRATSGPGYIEPLASRGASDLLNYLSQTAAASEREILKPHLVPSFATIRGTDIVVPPRAKPITIPEWTAAPPKKEDKAADSCLKELALLLSSQAEAAVCKAAQECVSTGEEEKRPSAVTLLDRWLSDGGGGSTPSRDDGDDFDDFELDGEYGDDSAEAFALVAYEEATTDGSERGSIGEYDGEYFDSLDEPAVSDPSREEEAPLLMRKRTAPKPPVGELPSLNVSQIEPELKALPGGRRKEKFENGAEIVKDSLGRVIEVRSPLGPLLRARYDDRGDLKFFVRTDSGGKLESYGESDKHGVVVRDPSGRVRAAGEAMAVDRVGRLSIVRRDGQFWSIDMARGLHVERRQLVDDDGRWRALTAVFAFDGFRMVTRFQSMKNLQEDDCAHCAITETIRLYGRDGSVIEFESEDDIEALRPSRVWPPGSRKIDRDHRRRWQAGTAWQAVKEYVQLLKSGSG